MSASENKQHTLFVTDIETTGLDEKLDAIVEIASIAVNARTLEELGRFHRIIRPAPHARFPDPFILKMKSENGLWADIASDKSTNIEEAMRSFTHFVTMFPSQGKVTLAGDSVHFDLRFLNAAANGMMGSMLNHRVVNVSTFREVFSYWDLPWIDDKTPGHRAMADAEKSLEKLRYAQRFLKGDR